MIKNFIVNSLNRGRPGKKWICILLLFVCSQNFILAESCGDVNSSGEINIVDALMTAQFYIGLNPPNFIQAAADVSGNGVIDIVDALQIAQFHVGLIDDISGGCPLIPVLTEVRYMMAGDSITSGGYEWRDGMVKYMQGKGFTVTTVGQYTDVLGYNHCAQGSMQTSWILQNVEGWVNAYQPNVINILIGVNDLRGNTGTSTIAGNMDQILGIIYQALPEAYVVLDSVLRYTSNWGGDPARVPEINAEYYKLYEKYKNMGMLIYWGNLYDAIPNSTSLCDGLHPAKCSEGAAVMVSESIPFYEEFLF